MESQQVFFDQSNNSCRAIQLLELEPFEDLLLEPELDPLFDLLLELFEDLSLDSFEDLSLDSFEDFDEPDLLLLSLL